MKDNNRVYPNVILGAETSLGDFLVLGEPPRGYTAGEVETRIGARAVIRSHTVIYAGNVIGEEFQTGHGVLIREYNQIGNHVSVGSHSVIEHHVIIGNEVRIHTNVFVPEFSTLDDGCWIGPGVIFTNARYPLSQGVKERLIGPTIRRGAKIGAGAVLLPGITIGESALIGAGSVVIGDVPDYAVCVGNPAHIVKTIQDIPEYDFQ